MLTTSTRPYVAGDPARMASSLGRCWRQGHLQAGQAPAPSKPIGLRRTVGLAGGDDAI